MRRLAIISFLGLVITSSSPTYGGTKEEMMRLQNDVLALQNQIRIMEQSFSEQIQGLKSLVVQLNDQMGKSGVLIEKLSGSLENQVSNGRSSDQITLQEIRNLAAKFDDAATRISVLAQQVADLKLQSKALEQSGLKSPTPDGSLLSADAVYNAAYNDLVQGNFDLAISGFTAFVKNYKAHDKADDALYNIGEAYYNQLKYPQAISAFTQVLTDYPEGDKIPSSLFKRGKAELALQERDNALEDFKSVIQKYNDAPEAGLARAELEALGINLSKPVKPAPARRKP
jgi:tol-pal system protein YbgF